MIFRLVGQRLIQTYLTSHSLPIVQSRLLLSNRQVPARASAISRRHRLFSNEATTATAEDVKEATAHPHLRPPRKLRQVSDGSTSVEDVSATTEATALPGSETDRAVKRLIVPRSDHRWSVVSYCTASEYKLDALKKHLHTWRNFAGESVYQLTDSFLTAELGENAVHYKLSKGVAEPNALTTAEVEPGEVFIFSEGTVVFWNVPKADASFVLKALEQFEVKPYPRAIVEHEAEYLHYSYLGRSDLTDRNLTSDGQGRHLPGGQLARLTTGGQILLDRLATDEPQFSLVKYTFSDAIAMSVKLATYESLLQKYVASIENTAEDMKTKGKVGLTKDQVLRKTGELFDLRHAVNLGSNMLDPPDFYWDRDDLENLYRQMCTYLNISRRTKVINEKLNHCYALVEFFRDHLNNAKSVRLELWIIALIMVEVVFEFLHFLESYRNRELLFASRPEATASPPSASAEVADVLIRR
ncbi:putative Required for meiotic nuclear division protein 1-like protein [Hypsibius exemplaris]|uniref:Required for meiotic nuclear division protein 1-like protein n=1 Tax=Hypsibius exemplaris TaxID=2072580 RepID=A0A1W0WBQ4_HYPEX|nr:putative Required for meiotic nuclear division protein 1-like protein [Hypsibius exemplaris]